MKTQINVTNLRNVRKTDPHHITAETADGNKVEFKRRLREGWTPWLTILIDGVVVHDTHAEAAEKEAWNQLNATANEAHFLSIDANRKSALEVARKFSLFPTMLTPANQVEIIATAAQGRGSDGQ